MTTAPRNVIDVAADLGLDRSEIELYGDAIAKVRSHPPGRAEGQLVLVSAMTPTPAGEGKTTTAIGLADALRRLGASTCLALRQPSLGPCFGRKGGGTGTGRSQLQPADRINLHFTGDSHAVESAHNLLAAVVDNHLQFRGDLDLDPERILWRRVLDVDDRALRRVRLLGAQPRTSGFDITAASEIMAALCFTEDVPDLRRRLDRMLVAADRSGRPVTAERLRVTGALLALLRDALLPNLVQTLEGTPALVHGGPFANIAHGASSVLATRLGLGCAAWVITEAGFGFDLGGEKFLDLACRGSGLVPRSVVLVATLRALRHHGEGDVERGLPNLWHHIESVRAFGLAPIVALNAFPDDDGAAVEQVRKHLERGGVPFALCTHVRGGGDGALDLARAVVKSTGPAALVHPYAVGAPAREKIERLATTYGAAAVRYASEAERDLEEIERWGYGLLPICMAKTPASLTDDPSLRGRPRGFALTVTGVEVHAGPGFLVVLCGDVVRMPGLPRSPAAEHIDLVDGAIVGLG